VRWITGNSHSSIFDSLLIKVMEDRMVKVVIWYDNELSYSIIIEELIQRLAKMDGIVWLLNS
jgi:glyceraldehyde 3-phosphate dehydrogenase